MKTVTMRIRGSSAEDLEEAGLAVDSLCESTSKLRNEIKALSGVDIMLNPTEYKSTYQIMLEIADVWDKLTDVNQATLLETLGGKRNAQVLASILNNVDDLKGAYADAQNAAGTMAESTNQYLDSISGKSQQIAASYQELSSRIFDSDFLKSALNVVYQILDALNKFDEATNGAVSAAVGFTLAVTAAFIAVETLHKVLSIKAITTWASNLTAGFTMLKSSLVAGSLTDILAGLQLMPGLAAAAATAIAMIGYAAYKAYQDAHPSLKDLREDLESLKSSAEDLEAAIDANNARIRELNELASNRHLTLVEQSEIDRLNQENALLEQKYRVQQKLIEQQEERVRSASLDKAESFLSQSTTMFAGTSNEFEVQSGSDQVDIELQQYKEYTEAIRAEYAAAEQDKRDADQAVISKYNSLIKQREDSLTSQIDTISNLIMDLDPEKDADIIKRLQGVVDKIEVTIGGPSSAGNIIQQTFNSRYYESATSKLKELANAGTLTEESIRGLCNRDGGVKELIDYLQELGLFNFDNVSYLAAQLRETGDVAPTLSQTLSGVSDQLKTMTDRYDLLSDAQNEFNTSGALSSDTLSSIVEKYPELASNVGLYIAGMKSGKELLADISTSYQDDVSKYKRALAEKLSASPEFYNSLSDDQKTYINDLAKSYGIDLKNFKDLETAKLTFQAQIIQKLAANYAQYTGASMQTLYDSQQRLILQIDRETNYYRKMALKGELTQVTQSIQSILQYQNALDDIALNGVKYDPSKYSPSKIKDDSKSGSDAYKQNVEKEIKILQHKREMDLITDEEYYNQLEAIENKYYKDSAAHREKYKEEIWDLDQEIFNGRRDILSDWISDQEKIAEGFNLGGDLNSQKKVYEEILNEVEKMIDSAIKYGLDENSDYVQELRDQYHKTCQDILSMVQDAYDSFKSYADDFEMWDSFDFTKIEFLEKNLEEIKKLYQEGTLGWKEYVEAYNEVAKELYDTKKESIETIIDMTMEMIEQEANDEIDALDDQIDKLNEIIDLKKKLLQDTKDEKDHEKQVAEAVSEIAKLQSKIAQLSLDDSREAIAKRADLEEQLAEKQKELADLQGDYALDKTLDVLDETKEAKEDEVEAEKKAIEKSIDSWVKKYKLAIDRIDNDWDNLYNDLNNWMAEHRDSIDGPDSLKTAWENVDQMVRQTGQDIESIYNGNGNIGLNPNSVDAKKAQEILDQMAANSALAKQLGTSQYGGVNLHEENEKLADNFYKLTGQKLTYDNGWRYANGKLAYTYTPSSVGSSSNTVQSSGSAYQATVSQYGEPPSGTLKVGSSGDGVKWLQYYLKQLGYFSYGIDGNFYTRTEDALKMFQKMAGLTADGIFGSKTRTALKKYHNGGIVDRTGAINDKEVLSILETGEIVLDDKKKATLSSIFGGIKASLSAMTRVSTLPYQRRVAAVGGYGDTFAPQVSVNISHNGKMTDRDAKRYGDIAADATLEKLRTAFNKRGIS